jgi:hypothetical protein
MSLTVGRKSTDSTPDTLGGALYANQLVFIMPITLGDTPGGR